MESTCTGCIARAWHVHSTCILWHVLTARIVHEGEAFIIEGATPHALAEAPHAVLHITPLRRMGWWMGRVGVGLGGVGGGGEEEVRGIVYGWSMLWACCEHAVGMLWAMLQTCDGHATEQNRTEQGQGSLEKTRERGPHGHGNVQAIMALPTMAIPTMAILTMTCAMKPGMTRCSCVPTKCSLMPRVLVPRSPEQSCAKLVAACHSK